MTVNLCLERSANLEGSQVLFFGRKPLLRHADGKDSSDGSNSSDGGTAATAADGAAAPEQFLVGAAAGWATVHWGAHPHLVTTLRTGQRTNVVLTYCFAEAGKSTATKGDCFTDASRVA